MFDATASHSARLVRVTTQKQSQKVEYSSLTATQQSFSPARLSTVAASSPQSFRMTLCSNGTAPLLVS